MELNVFTSKHGTRVVTASQLHSALQLPTHHYGRNVRRWLKDVYELSDGIRRPEILRDFGSRPRPADPIEDYYFTLELAKLIALRTNSKHKIKVAHFLDRESKAAGQLCLF
jgi:hypothetical protein